MPIRLAARLLMIASALLLCACAGGADAEGEALLDDVPASARFVATGSLYDCAGLAGGRVSGGELRGGPALDRLASSAPALMEPLRALALWHRHADLTHMAVLCDSATATIIVTALRTSDDEAERAGEGQDIETEHLPEATLYATDRAWVVSTPSRLWAWAKPMPSAKKRGKRQAAEPRFDPSPLDSALSAAARSSMAAVPGAGAFLRHDGPLRMALDMRAIPQPSGEDAAAALVLPRADAQSITLRVTYIDAAGRKVDPFSRLAPIDENVYSYFPAATVATAAVGADRHTLRSMLSHYGRALPLRTRAALELASGYLADSAATTALALIPGGSAETIRSFSADTWTLLGLLPIEISRTEEFFELVDEMGSGQVACDIAGAYIAVSNGPLDDVASGEDIGEQLGASRLRLQAVVPYNSELMRALGLSAGAALELDCADGVTTARLTILGADDKPASLVGAMMGRMLK